jgi:cytosine deaminase
MVANIWGRVSRIKPEVWNLGSTAEAGIPNVILFAVGFHHDHDTMTTADAYLRAALDQARKSLSEGGIPIGSVLVHDGRIIGQGHNCRVQTGSAIDHGEMNCLRNAGRLPARIYRASTIYSTLSPCPMCSGAIVLYKIPHVVVGENKTFLGAEDYMRSQGIQVDVIQDDECIQMMTDFIQANPALWNEDIGV